MLPLLVVVLPLLVGHGMYLPNLDVFMSEYREFSSYKALDRTALFMGVPLLAAVFLLTVSVAIMFIGLLMFGIIGFLFALLLTPVAFFLRTITYNDDKALNMMLLELHYRGKRIAYKEFGNTLTYQPERYLRYEKTNEQNFILMKEDK